MTLDVCAVGFCMARVDTSAFVYIFADGTVSTVPVEADTIETSVIIEAGRIGITVVQVSRGALVDIVTGDAVATVSCIAGTSKVPMVVGTGGIWMAVMSIRAAFVDVIARDSVSSMT